MRVYRGPGSLRARHVGWRAYRTSPVVTTGSKRATAAAATFPAAVASAFPSARMATDHRLAGGRGERVSSSGSGAAQRCPRERWSARAEDELERRTTARRVAEPMSAFHTILPFRCRFRADSGGEEGFLSRALRAKDAILSHFST